MKGLKHQGNRPFLVGLRLAYVLALAILPLSAADQTPQGIQTSAAVIGSTSARSSNYSIVKRGANYRIWQKTAPIVTNQQGQVTYRTNQYTEMASGLHHLIGTNWVESIESIQIVPGGGLATNGQHQVGFAANINSSNAVEIVGPDGKQLKTHVMGLSYFDTATGSNVLIAELKDSIGQVTDSNRVVYADAFTDYKADVRYTYRRGSFEQDIVIREQLPSPAEFGLSPETTKFQVWTEFLDPPATKVTPVAGQEDVNVSFGNMNMGQGKAFFIGSSSNSISVKKRWVTSQGRTFLVEQVPFSAISAKLRSLPGNGGGTINRGPRRQSRLEKFPEQLPLAPTLAKRSSDQLALARPHGPEGDGLVMDYIVLSSSYGWWGYSTYGDVDFTSGTTFLIAGPVYITGNTTIEPGAIIKFGDTSSPDDPAVGLNVGSLYCPPSFPAAVLTSVDDNSVGEPIGSGSPVTATYNCYITGWQNGSSSGGQVSVSNLKFYYAGTAVTPGFVSDCEFYNCNVPILPSGGNCSLYNVLFSGSTPAVAVNDGAIDAEQITCDCPHFSDGNQYAHMVNCILTGDYNAVAYLSSLDQVIQNAPQSVFQSANGDNYYLANSQYRGNGSAAIDPGLAADIAQKTTYPPPQTAGQLNTGTPDLGYHYPVTPTFTPGANVTLSLVNGGAACQVSLQSVLGDGFSTMVNGTSYPNPGSFQTTSFADAIFAFKSYGCNSATVGVAVTKLPSPVISPAGGIYDAPLTVTIALGHEDLTGMMETVYRTEYGRASDAGGLAYWVSVAQSMRSSGSSDETIRAYEINAARNGAEYWGDYGHAGDAYTANNDAVIQYSLDGGSTWNTYTGPLTLQATATVQARTTKPGKTDVRTKRAYVTSDVATSQFNCIPASWLTQYFGAGYQSNPNAAAGADPDTDGVNNYEEYLQGRNPTSTGTVPDNSGFISLQVY